MFRYITDHKTIIKENMNNTIQTTHNSEPLKFKN